MSGGTTAAANLESLMDMLASEDGRTRLKARNSLVALGKPAVSSLVRALSNARIYHVRWEAAKALGAIGDPRSIPPLVRALEDDDLDVTWLAAEGLIRFGMAAWPFLMRALMKAGPDSYQLGQGVHHVLVNQRLDGFDDLLAPLVKDLKSGTVHEAAALGAYKVLKRMTIGSPFTHKARMAGA